MSNVTTTKDLKGLMNSPNTKEKFEAMLGERTQGFFVSVSNAVNSNSLLTKAEPNSIIMAAAVAASLDLPIDPNLGFAYIVPYNNKQPDGSWKTVGQFQMGWKGYVQLAQRTGLYKTINATEVMPGEIEYEDFLTGEIRFKWLPRAERVGLEPVGYVSYFRLLNGFEKAFYMSREEAHSHGFKYSQTFKKNQGRWKEDFDAMSKKTVIKLLLSKYGPLSIQMRNAILADQGIIKSFDNNVVDADYADNQTLSIDEISKEKEVQRIAKHIEDSKTIEELEQVYEHVRDANLLDEYTAKYDELKGGVKA